MEAEIERMIEFAALHRTESRISNIHCQQSRGIRF
jgi:hypothetical protein